MEKIFRKLKNYFGEYHLAVFNEEKEARWKIEPEVKNIPYLKAQNAQGCHIFIKPDDTMEHFFMLADDLDFLALVHDHQRQDGKWKPGRMIVETSPRNYQCWIRSDRPLTVEEKSYWLKKMGSDPGAVPHGRYGRCPGFRNRKLKYEQGTSRSYRNTTPETREKDDCPQLFPLSKLIWIDWAHVAKVPIVNFSPSTPQKNTTKPANKGRGGWCHKVTRGNYQGATESETDFKFALALMRRGLTDDEVMERLEAERVDWSKHKSPKVREAYIRHTVKKARSIIGV